MNRFGTTRDRVALAAGGALLVESVVYLVMILAEWDSEGGRLLGGPIVAIAIAFGCCAAAVLRGHRRAAVGAAWALALLTAVTADPFTVLVNTPIIALLSWAYLRLAARPAAGRPIVRAPVVLLAAAVCLVVGAAFTVWIGVGQWTTNLLPPEDIWWYAPPTTLGRAMPGEALVLAAVGMLRGSTRWASAAMAMVVLVCVGVVFSREVPVVVAVPAAVVLLALLALAFRRLHGLAKRLEPGAGE